jgi:hypothetical protein
MTLVSVVVPLYGLDLSKMGHEEEGVERQLG